MNRLSVLSRAALLAVAAVALGVPAASARVPKQQPAQAMAGPSRAVTGEIIDAIVGESQRAAVSLRVGDEPAPYFIAHKLTEVEVHDVVASLGSTTWKKHRHFVSLDARVHVGDYQMDNSNFVVANSESTDGMATIQLPVEATPRIARRATWLVTDAAYKEALEQMRAKVDTRRAGGAVDTSRPSYTRQAAVVEDEPVRVPALESRDELEQRARAISEVFRGQAHVRDSRVAFTSFIERRWYLNNEGTRAHDTRRVSGVLITAASQAEDGQELALYYTRYGHTVADLPGNDELLAEARKLSETLAALQAAPLMDTYTGPVLFEGEGAAAMVRYTLAPHLSGTPLPDGLSAAEAKQLGGGLSHRLGWRVLSSILSVIDDPTAMRAGKTPIIGGYRFDDEGVPAQRVDVIHEGMLKTLLMSRTPSKQIGESNGHARRAAPGGVFHGSATNLFVNGKGGQPRARLVKRLLAEAKSQGLPYALIVRALDDTAATAAPELSTRELLHMLKTTDPEAPPIALLAYKVYPDGREELVRGAQLRPVQLRAWQDVIAVGDRPIVFNYLASGEHPIAHKISGVGDGSVPSAGVESAVVTPDLLFKELDVVGNTAGLRPTPVVPRPGAR